MDIKGKTALVTGGAAGIGRATAVMLARCGAAKVWIADLDVAGIAETSKQVEAAGAVVVGRRLDISELDALEAWLSEAARDGGYDILFNNAGVVAGEPMFPEAGADKIQRVMTINLTAAILASEIAVQALAARGGGVIVNTVSTVALGTGFRDALYAASKAGLMMFTRCCAGLKDSHGVRVAAVLPGLTDTPILNKTGAGGHVAHWMAPILTSNERCTPKDIAAAVIDLIEDDALAGGDWVAVRRQGGAVERQWGHARATV